MTYLDYNATTPLAPAALEAMLPFLERDFGNASSVHRAGREARAAIDTARDELAAVLHARPGEIVFTGGGTEADNLAIFGLARAQVGRGKHVITSVVEHHAVLHACEVLEKRDGFRVTRLGVDAAGQIDLGELEGALTPETTLVSIMTANNETGARQPVREAAQLCRARGVLFHTDAIQSFGKEPLEAGVFDAVSLSAHKFYGPKGAGVLWLRAGLALERVQVGGAHEGERRAGTENVAAIVGMAAAARAILWAMEAEAARLGELRAELWARIQEIFPDAVPNTPLENSLANTLNVSFPGHEAESLLMSLDLAGICASSGSACMAGSLLASHVLLAMGRSPALARAAVRFSMGRETTAEDIELTAEALRGIAARAQFA